MRDGPLGEDESGELGGAGTDGGDDLDGEALGNEKRRRVVISVRSEGEGGREEEKTDLGKAGAAACCEERRDQDQEEIEGQAGTGRDRRRTCSSGDSKSDDLDGQSTDENPLLE
jgi:hypothetical protein